MLKLIDISVGLTFISLMLFAVVPASSEMTDEQYYSIQVDKLIEKCVYKDRELTASCMPTIQQYAALNCLKASFVAFYKRDVVASLMENKVGRKEYKVKHHINAMFLEVFKKARGEVKEAERLMNRVRETKD